MQHNDCDVLILGGGLAGQTLARQILLSHPGKTIILADRRAELPPKEQKVGEATVQASGYYYGKVLQLEEYLLQEHYLKYNLRFYWPSAQGAARYEELSQSFIRGLSNIPTYQLDRNKFEGEVLRRNQADPRFTLHLTAREIQVDLSEGPPEEAGPHAFRFQTASGEVSGQAGWVVDATGRGRLFAKRMKLTRQSPIPNGSTFFWMDGLIDIERLTDLSEKEIRLHPHRKALGHFPAFLATNHFCGEGYWFWVIPLHNRTSFGLVYDPARVPRGEVSTGKKCIEWVCKQYPMFARELLDREIIDESGFTAFAHDCGQTISANRWAMCGEACRFTDPLYSPGGDLISIYNTLITDAILTEEPRELTSKARLYEGLARAVYEAYVPSYAISQDLLGDQECFSLRYCWELAIYFSYFVFPMINDLFTARAFVPGFLQRFSRLGPMNRGMQEFLMGYYGWKKENLRGLAREPLFFDFYEIFALKSAETCFYKVGVTHDEARAILDENLAHLDELARWVYAYVAATVLGDERALTHPDFVGAIDTEKLVFDPKQMAERLAACGDTTETWQWGFEPPSLKRFRTEAAVEDLEMTEDEEEPAAAAGGGR
jgi:2-polyprenyl-6-methoxyphenol hydroxylase-like FAD-dependent oxidoreductase